MCTFIDFFALNIVFILVQSSRAFHHIIPYLSGPFFIISFHTFSVRFSLRFKTGSACFALCFPKSSMPFFTSRFHDDYGRVLPFVARISILEIPFYRLATP